MSKVRRAKASARVTPGRLGLTLEDTQRFGYGSCERHRPYKSRADARRAARRHVRAFEAGELPCYKCWKGMQMDPFLCPVNPRHWHAGHEWRTQDQQTGIANDPSD